MHTKHTSTDSVITWFVKQDQLERWGYPPEECVELAGWYWKPTRYHRTTWDRIREHPAFDTGSATGPIENMAVGPFTSRQDALNDGLLANVYEPHVAGSTQEVA